MGLKPRLLGADPLRGGGGIDWKVSSEAGLEEACALRRGAMAVFHARWMRWQMRGEILKVVVAQIVLVGWLACRSDR